MDKYSEGMLVQRRIKFDIRYNTYNFQLCIDVENILLNFDDNSFIFKGTVDGKTWFLNLCLNFLVANVLRKEQVVVPIMKVFVT